MSIVPVWKKKLNSRFSDSLSITTGDEMDMLCFFVIDFFAYRKMFFLRTAAGIIPRFFCSKI